MIKEYSLLALQKAIQQALKLDPSMPTKLEAFHGKIIQVMITPLNVHFFIEFNQQQILLLAKCEKAADTVIQSSPLGLIRLSFLPASKVRSLFNDQIQISGDVLLGQRIKQLFDRMDIDWEGHLAHFTGDVVAHQIGSWFRKGRAWKDQLQNSIKNHLTDYLQEETNTLPTVEEINDFLNDVDALKLDVERISAHIDHDLTPHENH